MKTNAQVSRNAQNGWKRVVDQPRLAVRASTGGSSGLLGLTLESSGLKEGGVVDETNIKK